MNSIEQYIQQYVKKTGIDLPEEELRELSQSFKEKTFKKGEHLVEAGEKSYFMAFITEGMVRFYYNTFEGKQINQTFKKENDLIVDYFAALTNEPAHFSIQALELTKVIYSDYRLMEPFYSKHRNWNKLGRIIIETNFIIKARREAALLQLNATERYLHFKQNFKDLFPRLTQMDIALYLAIDPSSLNRIIKKNNLD
jgi:CRP-like cAMP-binding protein